MAAQVMDFEELLSLAAPASPPPPPPHHSSSTSNSTSFFEDIYHLEETIANSTTTTTTTTTNNAPLTTMQLVSLSNLKLNNEIYSNRSLSIHRRILVKNFLTILYQLSPPMEWMSMQPLEYHGDGFEPVPGLDTPEPDDENMLLREDEQNGWMERTLSAAGLKEDYNDEFSRKHNSKNNNKNSFTNHKNAPLQTSSSSSSSSPSPSSTSSSSSPPFLSLSFDSSSSSSSSSNPTSKLPRPKSAELPQSLNSYLSTVFDVNWSVELPSKEDLFFTHAPSNNPSTSSSAPALSSVASKRKSITAASGLSLSFNADTIENSPSPRSSTTSTSSFSTISSASSASSVSSVGSTKNGATTPVMPLVRKSSLSSNSRPNNVATTPAVTTTTTVSPESRPLPARKASINNSKPTLVPGRRSSLLQTGQMPPALPAKNITNVSNSNLGSNDSTNTASTLGVNNNGSAITEPTALSRAASTSLSPVPRSPTPPARSPTLSSTNTSPSSPVLQPSKPAFSRRTSSLPAERPKPVQRTPSSENNQALPPIPSSSPSSSPTLSVPQANIIGLPRPLLNNGPSELSSSPPSHPSNGSTLASPSGQSQGGAPRYLRSNSEEQIATRNNTSYSSNKSPPTSPTYYPTQNNYNSSSPYTYPVAQQQQPPNALSKPSPTYLKASKSSPCLVGSENSLLDESGYQPMPDLYSQQQYQQNSSHMTLSKDGSVPVVRPLARSSSRRAMASYNTQIETAGSGSRSGSNHGALNISSPLPLVSASSGFNEYDSSYDENPYNQKHPYGHGNGNGHKYTQSMSNVSVISNSSVMTSNSQKSEKTGKWSSMKMMFGLRTKG